MTPNERNKLLYLLEGPFGMTASQEHDLARETRAAFKAIDEALEALDRTDVDEPEHIVNYHADEMPRYYMNLAKAAQKARDILRAADGTGDIG